MKMIHQSTANDRFKNKWGFIIACIGSSVGMVKYLAFSFTGSAEFGGAAPDSYILFVIFNRIYRCGIGEMAFGRSMQTGPLGALRKLFR